MPTTLPGHETDDIRSLSALASNRPADRPTFGEARALISRAAPRRSAEKCWDYLVEYYTPS